MEPDDLLCSRNARPPKALVESVNLWSNSVHHFGKGGWRRGDECGGGREMPLGREAWGVYLAEAGRSVWGVEAAIAAAR